MTTRLNRFRRFLLFSPELWVLVVALTLISVPYYQEAIRVPSFLTQALASLGLTRHAFERILYLVPVLLAGLFFGGKGCFVTSLLVLLVMLPRALLYSNYRVDSIFESLGVFFIGCVLTVVFVALEHEKRERSRVQASERSLRQSAEKFRNLFDNAYDAMFVHEQNGNIIAANRACISLTNHSLDELLDLKIADLIPEENWLIVFSAEQDLLSGGESGTIIETKLTKKDGQEIDARLSIDVAYGRGAGAAFQCTVHDISVEKRLQENLQYYVHQATRAQEEERKRIALELHDQTIQDLVVLSRKVDIVATKCHAISPEMDLLVNEIRQQTKDIMQSLRHMSQDLRPPTLDRLGLLPALGYLASEMTRVSHIPIGVSVKGPTERLSEEVEVTLFRICQEALMNVWKHSGAHTAEVAVEFNHHQTILRIRDDGIGFSMPHTAIDIAKEGKLGLMGMEERARLIGGRYTISSEPSKGTTVTVEVPRQT